MNPRWPVCIPSKGRAATPLTIQMFDKMGVPYTVFVEPQQAEEYARVVSADRLHVMPHRDKGLTFTRNYIWDRMAEQGHEWFWTFDDNIRDIYRVNHNLKIRCADGTALAVIEQFAERYENVAIAGMHYEYFAPRRQQRPPYLLNSRIYSNMLIRTDARTPGGEPYRNVTFYNDDTDLCLRVLKDGWVTVLIQAFVVKKITTMLTPGGMTDYYKQTQKRLEFAEELQRAHPDLVKVVQRYGRWHHYVDYSGFKQQLRRRPGLVVPSGVNEFGMVLQEKINGKWVDSAPLPAAPSVYEPVLNGSAPAESEPALVYADNPEDLLPEEEEEQEEYDF